MIPQEILDALKHAIDADPDPVSAWNELRIWVAEASGQSRQPVSAVLFVPIERVRANDYNPNSVAKNEMHLLHTSIKADGFTQPIVTFPNPEKNIEEIVDGFHRYTTGRLDQTLLVDGLIPIVSIRKPLADRMASTVRHNRARGKHSMAGMTQLVFAMLDAGRTDEEICSELGMESDEVLRLKHITGFAKLFESVEYGRAWETRRMANIRREYRAREHKSTTSP